MPASRSARAITLAPRSWPSRPGLAMTTLSLRIVVGSVLCAVGRLHTAHCSLVTTVSDYRHLFVLPPHLPKGVADLAHSRVGADRLDDRRHQIGRAIRGGSKGIERPENAIAVARLLQLFELGELRIGGRLVDVENLDWR